MDDETFNPPARPTIHSRVQFGASPGTFDPGQEKELAKSGLPHADFKRLTRMGVISGFEPVMAHLKANKGKPPAEEDDEGEELQIPSVSKLAEWLQQFDDPDQIRTIQESDTRATAQEHYANRLAELE